MFTLIAALIAGMATGFAVGSTSGSTTWGAISGIVAMMIVQIVIGIVIRRKVNKVNLSIQMQMEQAKEKIQRKINMMQQRPGMSQKLLQNTVEKDQTAAVHQVLELTAALKRYYPWSPLLSKQINTMKMMFHYQIKEFDKVDELMPKCLFFDPVSQAMRMARMYKKNDPQLAKFANAKLKRAKGDQGALLFALYSWILVKRDDVKSAVEVLAASKKRCDHEVLNANWERLVNGKVKNFSNAALGEMWYMLHLEEPKVKTQRMRPQF